MSESPHHDLSGDPGARELVEPTSAPHTGVAEVDDVLRAVEGLDDDVDTHVAVFETAHERLRGVLDRPPAVDEPA